ncbi:MAG TPA: GNAT family N-acetyltransferase [Vicinamibacteria bacterium]|nr:GNAT family N-acetyltransferase [Vicinamibacteria bacterium]
MSFDAFELLPWRPGWKYEYWDHVAHITPRHTTVTVRVCTFPFPGSPGRRVRQVVRDDESRLVEVYIAAFEDTIDHCDCDTPELAHSALSNVRGFFDGKRGIPLPASRVELDENGAVIGAALLVDENEQPPLLDMLFVAPQYQRAGVATSMVAAASCALYEAGQRLLDSRFMLGNEASDAWHRRFGFQELPDLPLARLRYRAKQHELWCLERRQPFEPEALDALEHEVERLRRHVDDLNAKAEAEGWEAVHPILHRR